ncbi:ABC transporter family substrate-binding protein [Corynebacterium sp. 3HC-13]|uniref:ABC transporter family substrate-binding protein n=1 Tax=Corynebacterium poyangense TaxID=2684405 RepID=UPI001CCA06C7|nr:ABC transporter family substrate-binding protein [Corynebacterium poyangense]MBZ8177002.1 ABC transporter family substrate-binding protein [Corynebacterium poyangense]
MSKVGTFLGTRHITGVILSAALVLGGCVANPGPPPVVDPQAGDDAPAQEQPAQQDASSGESARTEINVGVDPLRNGLNPHLVADESALVESVADLVLPSAYVNGQVNSDLLASVTEQTPPDGVLKTLRYSIRPEAQWSDGTPITGADFRYLWLAVTTTPGSIDAAGYRAIRDIRVSDNGRKVDVDFNSGLVDTPRLFQYLLPSHLLGNPSGFHDALKTKIPASAGRFLVDSVDQQRGRIILHRNDRFWGQTPAQVEWLRLIEIRDQASGVEQLRTGQISYLDLTPTETLKDVIGLVPGVQNAVVETPRQLRLVFNVRAPKAQLGVNRATLASLLDPNLVAEISAGRTTELSLPQGREAASVTTGVTSEERAAAEEALKQQSLDSPVIIGADPADTAALAAARAVVDTLNNKGIEAQTKTTTISDFAQNLLPQGKVDAILSWREVNGDAIAIASRYQCPEQLSSTATQEQNRSSANPRISNLSGFCDRDVQKELDALLAQPTTREEAAEWALSLEEKEHLSMPLYRERRVRALGQGMVGPSSDLSQWPAGLSSAATWRSVSESRMSQEVK